MNLAKLIDHTLLNPAASQAQIAQLCRQARTYGFASVCVNPVWVKFARKQLKGTDVKVCSVIGFALGATPGNVKAFEAAQAVKDGAQELDMVLNIGALKSGDTATVLREIRAVRRACPGKILKVILETSALTRAEKITACQLAAKAGADFVKTSTGFGSGGATAADVALLRKSVPPAVQVKAAGGIRTRAQAQDMLSAGATRLGTSNGVRIIEGK